MRIHDSEEFKGKFICAYLNDGNNIIGTLESIEESGILMNDTVEHDKGNREVCNYFIPHASISWLEFMPSGEY